MFVCLFAGVEGETKECLWNKTEWKAEEGRGVDIFLYLKNILESILISLLVSLIKSRVVVRQEGAYRRSGIRDYVGIGF